MGIKLVGNSKPIMPFTVEELAERLNDQKAIYDGVSVYLKQRGSQPLDTSMFANAKPAGRLAGHPAGFNTGNYSGKPAAQSAGRSIKSQVCIQFSYPGHRARDSLSPVVQGDSPVLGGITSFDGGAHRNYLNWSWIYADPI